MYTAYKQSTASNSLSQIVVLLLHSYGPHFATGISYMVRVIYYEDFVLLNSINDSD